MELWDAYDKDFNKVNGVTLIRPGPIPNGLFHLFCDIIVKHADGAYLVMQRDTNKYFFPGMWEVTAGGSALQNETPLECAIRELREETGLEAGDLIEIGRLRNRDTFFVQYLYTTNCDKDSIVMQTGETIAYKWVNRNELICMKNDLVLERLRHYLEEFHSASENDGFISLDLRRKDFEFETNQTIL